MVDKYETGADGHLKVGGEEYEVSSISYSIETDTADAQFTAASGNVENSLASTIAITGVNYSGSFEHTGSNEGLRQALMTGGNDATVVPRGVVDNADRPKLVVEESERTVTFHRMVVTSRSKDLPADDRSSATYDWSAEEAIVVET